jgi:hypothetical protein
MNLELRCAGGEPILATPGAASAARGAGVVERREGGADAGVAEGQQRCGKARYAGLLLGIATSANGTLAPARGRSEFLRPSELISRRHMVPLRGYHFASLP